MSGLLKSYPLPLAFLGLICTIAISIALMDNDGFQIMFLNSDTMYLPSIYRDLMVDGGEFNKWSFNAAPNLYPDFLLFSILMAIINHTIATTITFGILQYLLFVFLTGNIVHVAIRSLSIHQKALGILLSGLPFTAIILHNDLEFTFQLLSNAYHLGASISTLIAIRIFIQIFNKKQSAWWLIFLIHITLAGINDKLFWIQCLVPFLGLGLIFLFQKNFKLASTLLLILTASFLTANTYINSHREPALPTIERAFREFAFSHTKESATNFMHDLKMVLGGFDAKSIFYLGAFLFAIFFFVIFLKKKLNLQESKTIVFFLIATSLFTTVSGPIINGNYISYEHHRYFVGALLISFLVGVFFLISQLKESRLTRFSFTTVCLTIVICFALHTPRFQEKINLYPRFAQEVDTLIEKYQLKQGVSTYWNAKTHEYLCKNKICISAVFPDVFPYLHANSRAWYFDENKIFNFVIIDNEDHLRQLENIFPNGTQVVQEGDTKILLTPTFRFDPATAKLVILQDK